MAARLEGLDDLQDLFENAPCGYLSTDKDGRIIRANKTLAGWIGRGTDALLQQRFSDLLTVGGKMFYETHFAPMLRMQGAFNEVALDLSCANGRKLPVLVNAIERRDEAGKPLFVRITIFNASERRRYERNLLEAKASAEAAAELERQKSELREQFIAVLGHDLRNPLASIASGVRLLNRESVSDRGREVLRLMEGSVVRASALIDNVLDFARGRLGGGIAIAIQRDRPLEPAIRQVVAEFQSLAPDRAIETDIHIMQPVPADPVRIGQLVSNLLGNALTYGSADEPVRVRAVTREDRFELSVANAGEPIAEAAMARLFQPFFRGSVRKGRQGLGLGLYIASEIAKAHGGALDVTSTPEETRLTFRMPLAGKPDQHDAV